MLQVGRYARVLAISRETDEDRSEYVGRDGLLVQRLNVPWTPDLGALWKIRFEDGAELVFAEDEVAMLDGSGEPLPQQMDDLREAWDVAPRGPSVPFRRFGGGARAAPPLLALVVLCVAGLLLVWAGLSTGTGLLALAGGVLVILGIGAAAALVS